MGINWHGPRTMDDDDDNGHTLNPSYYLTVPNLTCTVRKLSCYVPVVSSILVSYCPNFNLSIPTFQLNLLKNLSCTVQIYYLILLNCYLVLSHIRLVMSENCLVLTQFWLVRNQNSTFLLKKSSWTVQQFHLILSNRCLVLSQFWLVLFKNWP